MIKFIWSLRLLFILGGLLSLCQMTQAQVVLVKDGKPLARIYAGAMNALAVQELNYHLEKMAGATLEVVTNVSEVIRGPALVLGDRAKTLGCVPRKTCQSLEGYRIQVTKHQVLISGESDDAVLLGVYSLLEKLGCDWVMPGAIGEIIPRQSTVSVSAMDESSAPDFSMRRLWYRGYPQPRLSQESVNFSQWLRRQKGGGWSHPAAGAAGHVWDAFIKKHKVEIEKDPTMLALVRASDGSLQRRGPQLESTHPRVIELFVQDIKDAYRKNIEAGKWTRDSVGAFGIGPADGLDYSLSSESVAAGAGRVDPVVGELDRTDELVLMGNRILAEVHKEYPNAYVGFYSYSTHADYPARYKPDSKMVSIFAPINYSRFHGVLDPNSKTQRYYRDVVEQWGKLSREQGNVLIYRGYNWNLAENMLPYSKVRIWGEELPFYKANGVVGLTVEATKAWSINGASDYIFMKLAWDTSRDWKQVLHTYCEKSFGTGAPAMERYFLRLIETQHAAGQEAGSFSAFPLIFYEEWVKTSQKDLAEALKVASTPEDKTRIEYVGYGVEALRLYLAYYQTTLDFDLTAAKAAYEAMGAHWAKTYQVNTELVANEVPEYLKRYILNFVEQGLKYASTPYRMIYKLPDALPTMFDPNEVGHRMNYFEPSVNDSGCIRTKTYSSTWDAQGLSGLRTGAVWYRVHFALPADAKNQPIGLFVGGVADEARVWLNGKVVGTSGRAFSKPSVFDLTEDVKEEGDNLLAIEVVRNSKANEIGLGGLIRPAFLFAGPRLEKKAAGSVELRRVLPGGELGEVIKP